MLILCSSPSRNANQIAPGILTPANFSATCTCQEPLRVPHQACTSRIGLFSLELVRRTALILCEEMVSCSVEREEIKAKKEGNFRFHKNHGEREKAVTKDHNGQS